MTSHEKFVLWLQGFVDAYDQHLANKDDSEFKLIRKQLELLNTKEIKIPTSPGFADMLRQIDPIYGPTDIPWSAQLKKNIEELNKDRGPSRPPKRRFNLYKNAESIIFLAIEFDATMSNHNGKPVEFLCTVVEE
jgi:hypothetical protein